MGLRGEVTIVDGKIASFYLFLIFFCIGLLYPYATKDRDKVILVTSAYRPITLLFVLGHCASYFLIPFDRNFAIFAYAAYISALTTTLLEIAEAAQHKKSKGKDAINSSLIYFSSIVALFFGMKAAGLSDKNFAQVMIFIFVVLSISIARKIRENSRKSKFLQQSYFALLILIAIMIARIFNLTGLDSFSMYSSEHDPYLRYFLIANAVGFFLVSNGISNYHFEKLYNREYSERKSMESSLLDGLSALAKARDNETGNHLIRTQHYMQILATRLDKRQWFDPAKPANFLDLLAKVAPLHDIGKVGIPDNILLKEGRLSPEEWIVMKTHTTIGEAVLAAAIKEQEDDTSWTSELFRLANEIAGSHHENWDGSGYPRGLSREAIPKSARMMSLVDIYDALTSQRPYKMQWTHDEAVTEITRLSGTKLDPAVVDAFLPEASAFHAVALRYSD